MGVKFDRLFEDVPGTFTEIQGLATPVPGTVTGTAAAGYLISPSVNDAFTIANRVLKANGDVYRLRTPGDGERQDVPRGGVLRCRERNDDADRAKGAQETRRQRGRDEQSGGCRRDEAGDEAHRAL
jgi:hypothetical protein